LNNARLVSRSSASPSAGGRQAGTAVKRNATGSRMSATGVVAGARRTWRAQPKGASVWGTEMPSDTARATGGRQACAGRDDAAPRTSRDR